MTGPTLREGISEVAGEERAQPLEVADVDRLIEPEVSPQLLDDFRGNVRVEVCCGRVARRQRQDEEDERCDAEQQRDRCPAGAVE